MNANIKVLIVDDLEAIRGDLKNNLKQIGYNNVHEAENGRDALEIIRVALAENTPFNLFFFDINMPFMNGIDLLKKVRELHIHQKTPVLMISTENEKEIIVQCILLGASDYLLKPFDTAKFQEKMNKIQKLLPA